METGITVREILDHQCLREIGVLRGGEAGLDRIVNWVHILEIRHVIKQSVDNNAMILTTGMGFTDTRAALDFFQDLIDRGVSAVAIETALYYHEIDREVIELADKNNLVLIEIPVISRFIDISKCINTMILNKESEIYNVADQYNTKLDELNVQGNLADGIRYTAHYLNVSIAYLPERGESLITSDNMKGWNKTKIERLDEHLVDEEIYSKDSIAIKKLNILDADVGYLVFSGNNKKISYYDLIIMERLSNTIKNELNRELLKAEENRYKKFEWIKLWMDGQLNHGQITRRLESASVGLAPENYFVFIIQLPDNKEIHCNNQFLLNSMAIKKCFEDEGMEAIATFEKDKLIYVVMSKHSGENLPDRIESIIKKLQTYKNLSFDYSRTLFSAGKIVKDSGEVSKSYHTALELLELDGDGDRIRIYDKQNIGRMLKNIRTEALEEFVEDNLRELLNEENKELLQTLKVYFDQSCNKQKTAEQLFVVRQTLYFRLHKIEDILGKGYDEGEKKFSIEFALRAHDYLDNGHLTKSKKNQ